MTHLDLNFPNKNILGLRPLWLIRFLVISSILISITFNYNRLQAQSSSLVSLQNGQLSYTPFAMKGQTNAVNTIPDFSYAGYKGGGVALPEVPVKQTISPVPGDDRQSIQNAIDAVEALTPDANGFRGAILLTAGDYEVDGQLFIEESGVVLRGEGQGTNGTVIHANMTTQHDFVIVQGTGSSITLDTSTMQRITTPYVAVGAYSFEIADAANFSVGDTIAVRRTPNQFWIDDLALGQYGWTPGSYEIDHERVITAKSGGTLTVDLPIVDVMEDQYGGGEVYKATIPGRIDNCGVENLRIESYYASDTDEDHGWSAIVLKRTVDSWVKKVTVQYFGYGAVRIDKESNFNTIEETACIDHKSKIQGGRRYSFTIDDGLGNLFQRCYTREGRHDLETGSRVTGPNVFLDNYSTNTYSDIGPHHRWSTGILFDNVRGGQIQVHNRGASGSGHGWVGSTVVFWNLESYKSNIKVSSPKGGYNFGIGCTGVNQSGDGFWESWNTPVTPRSLYIQQLEDRLGIQAVDNIVIPQQKIGDIYALLASWAGEGPLIPEGQEIDTTLATIAPIADTYVRGGIHADTNFGTDTFLAIKENSGTPDNDRIGLIKFDLSGITTGSVSVAKIRFNLRSYDQENAEHSLHLISDDSWTETGTVWNNKPQTGTLIESKIVPAVVGQWLEYDITNEVNAELSGDGIISLQLSEATQDHFYSYHSREAVSLDDRPVLAYKETNGTLAISASEDAFVRGGSNSSSNYGSDTKLLVKENSGTADNDRMGFVKFDLSSIPGSVASAKIRLKVQNDDPGSSHDLNLVSDDSWSENSITWDNRPSSGSLLGTQVVPSIGEWLEIDVTDAVNTELSGDGSISVSITESTVNTFVSYHSTEAISSNDHPQLIYVLGSPLPPVESTISITEDAYVRAGSSAGINFGTDPTIVIKSNSNTDLIREAFMKVDLSSITGTILTAKIRVKVQNDDGSGITHALRFVSDDSWSEGNITWNNKPVTGSTLASATVPNVIGDWLEFDVLAQAQTELNGDGTLSLNLHETTSNHYVGYHSKEASNPNDRPEFLYTTTSGPNGRFAHTNNENSTSMIVKESDNFNFYPNPVIDNWANFEFSLNGPSPVNISIFGIDGHEIYKYTDNLESGLQNIHLNFKTFSMKSGVYLYKVITEEFSISKKLIYKNR